MEPRKPHNHRRYESSLYRALNTSNCKRNHDNKEMRRSLLRCASSRYRSLTHKYTYPLPFRVSFAFATFHLFLLSCKDKTRLGHINPRPAMKVCMHKLQMLQLFPCSCIRARKSPKCGIYKCRPTLCVRVNPAVAGCLERSCLAARCDAFVADCSWRKHFCRYSRSEVE